MRATTLILLLSFACASPGLSASPPGSSTELRARLAALVFARREAPLEELLADLRTVATPLDDGTSPLAAAYEGLTRLLALDRPPPGKEAEPSGLLARWRLSRPDSVAAAILQVLVVARQTDAVSGAWNRFLKNTDDVPTPLRGALREGPAPAADPHAWVALLRCADDLGWDEEARAGLVRRALTSDGAYPPLAAAALLSWHEDRSNFNLADEATLPDRFRRIAALAPTALLPIIQARAAMTFDRLLGPELTAWYVRPLARDLTLGLQRLLTSDEARGRTALSMARLAAILRERELAGQALAAAGSDPGPDPWIGAVRTWIAGSSPLPPTWFRDPRR